MHHGFLYSYYQGDSQLHVLHNKKLKNTIIFFLDKVYYNCHCTKYLLG